MAMLSVYSIAFSNLMWQLQQISSDLFTLIKSVMESICGTPYILLHFESDYDYRPFNKQHSPKK